MELLVARCAGLDVHQATVVATVRVPDDQGGRRSVTETFGTMTPDLLALREWLQAYGVTHVALESTGVYWKPVYYVLEESFTCLVVNATHLKHVPGRRTSWPIWHVDGCARNCRPCARHWPDDFADITPFS